MIRERFEFRNDSHRYLKDAFTLKVKMLYSSHIVAQNARCLLLVKRHYDYMFTYIEYRAIARFIVL